jgi:NHL repeat
LEDGVLLVANSGADDIAEFDASLTESKKIESTYGSKGSGEGQFEDPTDIAFGGREGTETYVFYVADSGNNRVQKFSVKVHYESEKFKLTYTYDLKFGEKGTAEGDFSSPTALVLDPLTGDVAVTDTGNNRVEEFQSSGTYVAKFGSGGKGIEEFEKPAGLSTDASGDLYIADTGNNRVDVWSHPEWRAEPTPVGPRTGEEEDENEKPESILIRTSCTTWNECEAVGEYEPSAGGGEHPLAEGRKNGYEWSLQSVSLPSGTIGVLEDVSCASSASCIAVGEYGSTSKALAEGWNGKEWTSQSAAVPTGAKESYLEGVSCTSSTECTAVGTYVTSAGVQTVLAERWKEGKWTVQTTATLPAETKKSYFYGVSCVSSTSCTAAGTVNIEESKAEVHHQLVEHWNGTEWTIQLKTPEGYLNGVSCTSEKECMAVGEGAGKTSGAVGEHWNGTEWLSQTMVQPESGTLALYDVSCGSANSCLAVGRVGLESPFAERWNGTEWTYQSTTKAYIAGQGEHAGLGGIWCSSTTQCLTVGYAYADSGFGAYKPESLAEVYP